MRARDILPIWRLERFWDQAWRRRGNRRTPIIDVTPATAYEDLLRIFSLFRRIGTAPEGAGRFRCVRWRSAGSAAGGAFSGNCPIGAPGVFLEVRCLSLADYVRGPEGHLGGDRRVPTC